MTDQELLDELGLGETIEVEIETGGSVCGQYRAFGMTRVEAESRIEFVRVTPSSRLLNEGARRTAS